MQVRLVARAVPPEGQALQVDGWAERACAENRAHGQGRVCALGQARSVKQLERSDEEERARLTERAPREIHEACALGVGLGVATPRRRRKRR